MIPVSQNEKIDFKDEDGTVWQFKPRTGALEREAVFEILDKDQVSKRDSAEAFKIVADFVNKIVVGWNGKPDGMPSDVLNHREQVEAIYIWLASGRLTAEEKKIS